MADKYLPFVVQRLHRARMPGRSETPMYTFLLYDQAVPNSFNASRNAVTVERRVSDRRAVSRGGRRAGDQPGHSPQVLVADNYAAARTPIVAYLRRCGFDVVVAETAEQGIDRVNNRMRLALSGLDDAQTPRFYERLASASVPLIVLSSGSDTPVPFAPAAALSKPFHLQVLLRTIRKVLGSERSGAARHSSSPQLFD